MIFCIFDQVNLTVWLWVDFLIRTSAEIGYLLDQKLQEIIFYNLKIFTNTESAQLWLAMRHT